jgi:hypothetical protein
MLINTTDTTIILEKGISNNVVLQTFDRCPPVSNITGSCYNPVTDKLYKLYQKYIPINTKTIDTNEYSSVSIFNIKDVGFISSVDTFDYSKYFYLFLPPEYTVYYSTLLTLKVNNIVAYNYNEIYDSIVGANVIMIDISSQQEIINSLRDSNRVTLYTTGTESPTVSCIQYESDTDTSLLNTMDYIDIFDFNVTEEYTSYEEEVSNKITDIVKTKMYYKIMFSDYNSEYSLYKQLDKNSFFKLSIKKTVDDETSVVSYYDLVMVNDPKYEETDTANKWTYEFHAEYKKEEII